MGQKVHPIGFRLGVKVGDRSVKDWQGRWFATGREYATLLLEDIRVRQHIMTRMQDAGVSKVEIERSANMITVTIHAAKPGIVIGKSGVKVEELRRTLETMTGKRIRVTIQEIRQPEIDAFLVARSIADQLEKRVAFRRAMKQAVQRAQRFGAKGVRVQVSGRLGGSEMSRREWDRWGRVPLHTLRADIDYGQTEAHTTYGIIGVKVWVYRGDFTPDGRSPEEVAAELRQPDRRGPRATVRAEVPEAPVAEAPAPAVPAEVDYSTGGVFDPGGESGEIRPRGAGEAVEPAAPAAPTPPAPPTRPAPTPPARPASPPTPPAARAVPPTPPTPPSPPTPPTPPAPRGEE
jgi:small subunit ribosomal protein S3